jgi:hypothetical protein
LTTESNAIKTITITEDDNNNSSNNKKKKKKKISEA